GVALAAPARGRGAALGPGPDLPRRTGAPGNGLDDRAGDRPRARPIAVSRYQQGSEIEHPMALVIHGGLVTSTALNLVGLPVLYRRFGFRTLEGSRPVRT